MKTFLFAISFFFPLLLPAQVLSLNEAVALANQQNFHLQLAEHDIRLAREKVNELKTALSPKISTALDYKYYIDLPYQLMPSAVFGGPPGIYKEAQFGVPHNLNFSAQVTYPLVNYGIRAGIETAEKGVELNELRKLKTAEDIALEVSNVYYNAQLLKNQENFIDSNISNTQKLLQLTRLLYEQRMAKGTDVEKVDLQLSQLHTQKINVENQYQQALNVLKFLVGKPLSEPVGIVVDPGEDQIPGLTENTLTEVRLTRQQIELLHEEKRAINKSTLPVINLTALYGTTGYAKTGSNDFVKFFPLGYAGLQVVFPISSGGAVKKKLMVKDVEIEKARTQIALLEEKNAMEKLNIHRQLNTAFNNLKMNSQQIEHATNIYHNTLLLQKEGFASLTDVLFADATLREVQHNYMANLVALRKAELEYRKLTGNLLNHSNY